MKAQCLLMAKSLLKSKKLLKICILYIKILKFNLLRIQFIKNKANYPSISEAEEKTIQMLKMLNLEDVQSQHPYELSIGQKRRLSVAIALSSTSEYILLDEPTFGLDSHNTFNLIKLFQQR